MPDDGVAPTRSRVPGAAGHGGRDELDRLLDCAVQDTGAHAGAVFLLTPDGQALRLEVTTGLPAEYLAPWRGVGLASLDPVGVAVRERRLVWLSESQELARLYPRMAIALPYHVAVAVAPIFTGSTAWGTLLLFWPCGETVEPAGPGHDRVGVACRRLGRFLRDTAEAGRPVTPGPQPRTLPRPPTRTWDPVVALAAADFAERLPEGACSLDLEGRFTYLNATARSPDSAVKTVCWLPEKGWGRSKASTHRPTERPEAISGRKAQACSPSWRGASG